ncbi:MAG: TetR/AcrR family transcriptional regulator [Ignavibacteriales bacterium]|nr:MAG: TetR/AcrR family transcriptional regulator [Ignavibacteriaceae bacterium]MBW7873612.1 TetR/AcrR family transcriptional regulator [Ignavibacteria bacterium]MCZ2143842.1 TetR/AcrR family transcriptional regulator [Ignavibacteriales bacterium]OQY75758.1 MAG: hypothetical protein B6D45_05235 [Ignavibacteriales bacterium UTCHB3]MBV6445887.1 hypothetical protein [Ignavibacteriaceae bacterium]
MERNRHPDILKAAERRFIKHGVSKTTLDEIARDIRLSKSSIYHYFASKDDLYIAVMKKQAKDYISAVKDIFNNEEKKFQERFRNYFTLKSQLKNEYKLLFGIIMAELSENSLAEEKEILANLLLEEEQVLKLVLTAYFKDSLIAPKEDAAMILTIQTSMMPLMKEIFNSTLNAEETPAQNKLLDYFEQTLNSFGH